MRTSSIIWDATQRVATILPLMALCSCASGPSITRTPKGGYHATAGFVLGADREGVVAEITTQEGDHIKYVVKKENGTRVLIDWIRMKLGLGLANIADKTEQARIAADRDVTLGAQAAEVEKAGIAADVTKSTTLNPNLTTP